MHSIGIIATKASIKNNDSIFISFANRFASLK